MRAIVFRAPSEVSVEELPDPRIEAPGTAIMRITTGHRTAEEGHHDGHRA
ncbi:hypothetical protein [Kitasatospora sp. A2-31]|nr:hypothetical protein [Kitasatospora sp. A2-31]MCG6494286.1 hypothetical protein [Kitasatospora sp. A2-31]